MADIAFYKDRNIIFICNIMFLKYDIFIFTYQQQNPLVLYSYLLLLIFGLNDTILNCWIQLLCSYQHNIAEIIFLHDEEN